MRDLGTETHFEYGSRAGVWRLARLFDRFDVPVTVSACAVALQRNPEVAAWMNERGHDLLGHGLRWREYSLLAARRGGARTSARPLHSTGGRRPASAGLELPLLSQRQHPRPAGGGRRLSLPRRSLQRRSALFRRPQGQPDPDRALFQDPQRQPLPVAPGYSNPRDFTEDCRAAIDYLLDEADETGGRMLTICVHARWMGQPNRAAGLREVIEHVGRAPGALFMRREDIARYWLDNHARFGAGD